MGKEEKEKEKGEKVIAKAEFLFGQQKYRNAADEFMKAGELFFKLSEWQIAEKCFLFGAKSFIAIERYKEAADLLRLSANCSLMMDNLAKARDYYDSAAKNAIKSEDKNKEANTIINITFSYLAYFLQGLHDKAIQYIAKMKEYIDINDFNENPLVQLVKLLTSAILNGSESALHEAIELYPNFKFRAAENKLIRMALIIASIYVEMEISLELTRQELINNTDVQFMVHINIQEVFSNKQKDIQDYQIKNLKIKELTVSLSENLMQKEDIKLPLEFEKKISIPLTLRTTFPGKGFIGPVVFLFELENKYRFYAHSDEVKINVKSLDAQLSINFEPQQTPIVNQTFPMNVELRNNSEGEAVDLIVKLEFPEELKMMRGTFEKKILSLGCRENISWEISVKSLQPGKIPIKTMIDYNDPDGKKMGPITFDNEIEINL